MIGYIWGILQYILGIIEIFISFKFCSLAFKVEKGDNRKYIWCSIAISFLVTLNRMYRLYSILILIFTIVIVILAEKIIHKEHIKNIALLVSLYYFTLALLDMFIIFLFALLLEKPNLGTEIGRTLGRTRIIILTIPRSILLLIPLFAKQKLTNVLNEIFNYRKYVMLFIVLEIGGIICFQEVYAKGITIRLEMSWYVFCFLLFIISIIIFSYVFYRNVKEEKDLLKLKNEMLEYNYSTIYKCYKDSMKLFHDMKGHINTIYQMIIRQDYQRVTNYINTIQKPIDHLEKAVYSGNYIIDLVLNYKFLQVRDQKIRIETFITPVDNKINILDSDLCAALNNLLDNAIEANQEVIDDKKWISLSIKQVNKMIIIKVSNSMSQKPILLNGKYVTMKKDKRLHGYGMESIENIAEKYEGFFLCRYDQQSFTATLTLCV